MSRTQLSRQQLVIAIISQLRASSTRTVLFHAAIAERLGLNASDHKCADLLLSQAGACTPGRLAELTGLSTGAITGVVDRLERAGFVAREHDVEDRRRILLRVTPKRAPDMQTLFAPLAAATRKMCEGFSVDELNTVLRFMHASMQAIDGAAAQLRGTAAASEAGPRPHVVPAVESRKPERKQGESTEGRGAKRTASRIRIRY